MTSSSPPLHPLNELNQIEQLLQTGQPYLRSNVLAELTYKNLNFPLYSLALGSEKADSPVLVFVGGVHGLERIGSEVILAFMETLIERLHWDTSLIIGLENLKLVFIPVVNPVGIYQRTRSNGNCVDLMRNAPVDAEAEVPMLIGGHRLTPLLPWYRGAKHEPMEQEAMLLCEEIRTQTFSAPYSIVLDCHSGFGFQDRIWFPYACKLAPLEHLAEVYSLKQLLTRTYPHLDYMFEPQARHYTTHGDLWDYLYRQSIRCNTTFIPLTLEMGSWRWVKKNPLQLFQLTGLFHPVKPHRVKRVLRRHTVFMEFLIRAVRAYACWNPADNDRHEIHQQALKHWYP